MFCTVLRRQGRRGGRYSGKVSRINSVHGMPRNMTVHLSAHCVFVVWWALFELKSAEGCPFVGDAVELLLSYPVNNSGRCQYHTLSACLWIRTATILFQRASRVLLEHSRHLATFQYNQDEMWKTTCNGRLCGKRSLAC